MKFYLVDYENVHEAGLSGLNKLDSNAEVHIFYSKNADKLNFDLLNKILETKATVITTKVVAKSKNALDFQLSFFAGELAAKYPNCEIDIVSQDQGYDCLCSFTQNNKNLKLNRVLNLSGYNSIKQKNELQQKVAEALKEIKVDGHNKGELINFIVDKIQTLKTKNAINNNLQKYLKNDVLLKNVYKAIKPLLKDKT